MTLAFPIPCGLRSLKKRRQSHGCPEVRQRELLKAARQSQDKDNNIAWLAWLGLRKRDRGQPELHILVITTRELEILSFYFIVAGFNILGRRWVGIIATHFFRVTRG